MTVALYTRRGDGGTSVLYGCTRRRKKSEMVFEVLGTVDELNAHLGLCHAKISYNPIVHDTLREIQHVLFMLQAEIAGAPKHVTADMTTRLEALIAGAEGCIENPRGFVIPGATEDSALLDIARTVARRAERTTIRLTRPPREICVYLNRVSSALYALARYVSHSTGAYEERPHYGTKFTPGA